MARVKRGVVAHRRKHKKVLKQAKGYYGAQQSGIFRVAKQAVTKAGQYAYRDRQSEVNVSIPRSVDHAYQCPV